MAQYRKAAEDREEQSAREAQERAAKEGGTLRSGGVSNTAPDKALAAAAENTRLQQNPPPLAHVDPTTGRVLSQPLDTGKEANVNTVPGTGGVRDARPNNGQAVDNVKRD